MLASRQEVFAIGEGPAVILDVGKFDARGGGGLRERDHILELIDIAALDDKIQRESNPVFF